MAYDEVLGNKVMGKNCLPAEEIQQLAREDEEEREQAPHYHGLYENRIVELGDLTKRGEVRERLLDGNGGNTRQTSREGEDP